MNYYKTYPKDFRSDKVLIEKKKCFFIMPFAKEFDSVFGVLQGNLLDEGYMPVRVDAVNLSVPIMSKIMRELLTAQYVVVDISTLNPNVFYELGIAHCFKDARNILLIKNKQTKAPSDITHINYIEYDPNNLILLKERILNTLEEIKYLSELESTLDLYKIPLDSNSNNSIVEILETMFLKDEIILICYILNNEYTIEDMANIENLINKYIKSVKELQSKNFDTNIVNTIITLFIKLLVKCSNCSFIPTKVNELLYCNELLNDGADVVKFRTNLALAFAAEGKLINVVMPWILEYFSQSKSTHVDLNRYNLEAFLLSSTNAEINNAIINAVFASDRHIREHMSDIIGEKRLLEARSNLLIQLNREPNIYTAASLMEAIGKIGTLEDIAIITRWIENHYVEISNPGGNFVFKHARNAITALDCSFDNSFLKAFNEKYEKDIVI